MPLPLKIWKKKYAQQIADTICMYILEAKR